ncbi:MULTISPECIES: A24 family peptidase [unclassified Fusibacter]|uniref:prepilin peptidase n=1 Tax=unclassified Fusibacter TaxID=2624464 RepID=UPI0010103BFA|nr:MULTISPECIES: A24 family peptidase [unclassified Fusibacter]MCK8058908.1 prepilin peptidase [Fusibacter sp. A2]NPE21983.1 prepilin peptidase [Fusibacter sp. A1]RXV61550.1 prepilin peptidase [Fusibacter sp. A1]
MILAILFIGVYGIVIGSFLNVVIYRLPLNKSIVAPRSQCGSCHTELKPLDLIPVFSYLIFRGKCRHCGQPYSIRYPLIEGLNGIVYIIAYMVYGLSLNSFIVMVLSSMLICVTFIDIDHKIIPNSLNLSIGVLAVINLIVGQISLRMFLLGGLYGGGFILFLVVVGVFLKVEIMGMGDLKLMFFSGLLIGPIAVISAYLIAFTTSGIFVSVLLLFKLKKVKDAVAFGPFLSLGILLSVLFYPTILQAIL